MEQADAALFKPGDVVTFVNWGNMRVVEIKRSQITGDVDSVEVDLDLDNTVFIISDYFLTVFLLFFRITRRP